MSAAAGRCAGMCGDRSRSPASTNCGQFEGLRGNTVINGDQQTHAIVVELPHHGGIMSYPSSIREDSGFRLSTQRANARSNNAVLVKPSAS